MRGSLLYSSGDKDPYDTSLNTFDPMYPLAWNFYGFHAAFATADSGVGAAVALPWLEAMSPNSKNIALAGALLALEASLRERTLARVNRHDR